MKILKKTDSRRAPSYLPSVSRRDRFLGFLFGDDIFISYSHRDAINYAPALATALAGKKFVSYLDQYGGEVENELPPRVIRHLKRSKTFVLVGTPAAVQSDAVKKEVEIFKTTGRPIIPIDVGNALTRAEWIQIVKGIPVSKDNGVALTLDREQVIPEEASSHSENVEAPSPLVVGRVVDSFRYTRRNQRLNRMALLACVLLVVSIAGAARSFVAAMDARFQAAAAVQDRDLARRQEAEATSNATAAELDKVRAEVARGFAEKGKADADKAANAAVARERVALQNEARASANARRQETRASSLGKVATSAELIGTEPAKALAVGVSAYQQYPTREAQGRLLDNLQRYPGLEKIQRHHVTGVSSVEAPVDGVLVSVGEGSDSVWNTGITPKRNNLVFWDARTLEPIRIESTDDLFDQSKVSCISEANLCATNNEKGIIVLWTVDVTNKKATPHPTNIPFPGLMNGFELVSETLLAVGHKNGQIYLVNLDRPDKPKLLVTGFRSAPQQIILSTHKDKLAVTFEEGISLITLSQPQAPKTLSYSKEQKQRFQHADSLSFNSDDELLAIGSKDGVSLIVQVSDLQPLGEPIENGGGIVAFARGKRKNRLVTANADGVSVWQLNLPGAGRTRRLQIPVNGVRSLSFLPESDEELVTGLADGTVAVWDLDSEDSLARDFKEIENSGQVEEFAFDENGKYLLGYNSADHQGEKLRRLWHFAGDKPTAIPQDRFSQVFTGLRFPRRPAEIGPESVSFEKRGDPDHTDKFVLTPGGRDVFRSKAVLTSDGRTMITIDKDEVVVWDVTNRQKATCKYKPAHGATPTALAISHHQNILAVGYKNGEIVLFDYRKGREIGPLTSPFVVKYITSGVSNLAFSFDDSVIASNTSSNTIDLWDRFSGSLIGSLDVPEPKAVDALVFTPSGKRLLSHGLGLWNVWDISVSSWIDRTVKITGLKNQFDLSK